MSFYNSVFGWKISRSELDREKYKIMSTISNELIGELDPNKEVSTKVLVINIYVTNLNQTLVSVINFGGKVIRAKYNIDGYNGSVILDPSGNQIGLREEN